MLLAGNRCPPGPRRQTLLIATDATVNDKDNNKDKTCPTSTGMQPASTPASVLLPIHPACTSQRKGPSYSAKREAQARCGDPLGSTARPMLDTGITNLQDNVLRHWKAIANSTCITSLSLSFVIVSQSRVGLVGLLAVSKPEGKPASDR